MVQLRVKDGSDDEVLAAAARYRALCDEHDALFWLNDRPDLALEARADGVHVGQDDIPVAEVREQVGSRMLIGLSTHSPAQLDAALHSEADQLSVGPVWETPTKLGRPAAGLSYVSHAAAGGGRAALVRDRRHRSRQRRRGGGRGRAPHRRAARDPRRAAIRRRRPPPCAPRCPASAGGAGRSSRRP